MPDADGVLQTALLIELARCKDGHRLTKQASQMTAQGTVTILKSIGYSESPGLVFVFEDGDDTKIPNDLVLRSALETWRSEETIRFFSLYIDNRPGESWSRPPLPHPDQRTGMHAQGVEQEM
ncbi:hypothetical protein LTS17_008552 [Exophiala oligosperma]